MSYPIVTFTSGHISIRRGKKLHKYTPTLTSLQRLSTLMFNGPTDHHETNRSSIYTWHGRSTLTDHQRDLLDLYIESEEYKDPVDIRIGIERSCRIVDIHPVLIELVTSCQDGKAKSRCYTCATRI